jgi:hypothetical protein
MINGADHRLIEGRRSRIRRRRQLKRIISDLIGDKRSQHQT